MYKNSYCTLTNEIYYKTLQKVYKDLYKISTNEPYTKLYKKVYKNSYCTLTNEFNTKLCKKCTKTRTMHLLMNPIQSSTINVQKLVALIISIQNSSKSVPKTRTGS